jgi:hypothetical protein
MKHTLVYYIYYIIIFLIKSGGKPPFLAYNGPIKLIKSDKSGIFHANLKATVDINLIKVTFSRAKAS